MDSVGHRLNWILEQISALGVGGDVGAAFEFKKKSQRLEEVCSHQGEVLQPLTLLLGFVLFQKKKKSPPTPEALICSRIQFSL